MTVSPLRWVVKKAARAAVSVTSDAARRVRAQGAPACRVLTYHRIAAARRDPFSVSPEDFEAQMAWLAGHGRAVPIDALVGWARGEAPLPRDGVVVTIDDGGVSTLEAALPALVRHGVPAVAFVSASLVGLTPDLGERLMTWAEIRACAAAGLEIGSHGARHRSAAGLDDLALEEELAGSKARIEDAIGRTVRAFAYPFGTRADVSPRTEAAARAAGYTVAFHSQHGAVRAGRDPLSLPRVKVEGGEGLAAFARLVRGGMDGWSLVDRHLGWTQAAGRRPPLARA